MTEVMPYPHNSSGGVVAVPSDEDFTGLEDFEPTRLVIPRLTINHKDGTFKCPVTEQTLPSPIEVIMLVMVKQRILWHVNLGDDGELPLCKSPDGQTGFPTPLDLLPRGKEFPWDVSRFNPNDWPAGSSGMAELPCKNCGLKEWKSHPMGVKPYCAEQYNFGVLYRPAGRDDMLAPAVLTCQKTSMKPAEMYMSKFRSMGEPMFVVITKVHLDLSQKGGNTYSIPRFESGNKTSPEQWEYFKAEAINMRTNMKTPPQIQEDDDGRLVMRSGVPPMPSAAAPVLATPAEPTVASQPIAPPVAAAPAPVPAPAPVVATPVPAAQPAVQQPVVAPVATTPVAPARVPQPAAPVAAEPVAPAPAPVPAPNPPAATPVAPATGLDDDDDLPF